MYAFVLDDNKKPLSPVHAGQARILLKEGKAAVFRRYPFTIILKQDLTLKEHSALTVKIDPGSKHTGIVVMTKKGDVLSAFQLNHRSDTIRESMSKRRGIRRSRRHRKTRYRKPRFDNRTRVEGWLAPSVKSPVENIMTWIKKLMRLCPINKIVYESVKFDMQKMHNPEITGIEYQRGELLGFEVREYLLEKYRRTCSYCKTKNVPFELDHIIPRSRGGSDKVSNLTLSCKSCNSAKGNKTAAEYGYPDIQKVAGKSYREAAQMNSTRKALGRSIEALGLPVETGTGAQTKFNRKALKIPKSHVNDAACVGLIPSIVSFKTQQILNITATGHGSRQMTRVDKYGFPRTSAKTQSSVSGFKTGDIVVAHVPTGKKKGIHKGKVAVRASGSFNITTSKGVVQGINAKHCKKIQARDGYRYDYTNCASSMP